MITVEIETAIKRLDTTEQHYYRYLIAKTLKK
jgi:hypothetical protein